MIMIINLKSISFLITVLAFQRTNCCFDIFEKIFPRRRNNVVVPDEDNTPMQAFNDLPAIGNRVTFDQGRNQRSWSSRAYIGSNAIRIGFRKSSPSPPSKNAVMIHETRRQFINDGYIPETRFIATHMKGIIVDPGPCLYKTMSILLYGSETQATVTQLRQTFKTLLSKEGLMNAKGSELSRTRLAQAVTDGVFSDIMDKTLSWWRHFSEHAASPAEFIYLFSYIINRPVYGLDLSTNVWKTYDMSNAPDQPLSDIQKQYVDHGKPLGPPYMVALHKRYVKGELVHDHISAMIHQTYAKRCPYAMTLDDYQKFINNPTDGLKFIFAKDNPTSSQVLSRNRQPTRPESAIQPEDDTDPFADF